MNIQMVPQKLCKTADALLGRFLETSHKAAKRQRELQFGKKRISSWVFGLKEPTILSQKEQSIGFVNRPFLWLETDRSINRDVSGRLWSFSALSSNLGKPDRRLFPYVRFS